MRNAIKFGKSIIILIIFAFFSPLISGLDGDQILDNVQPEGGGVLDIVSVKSVTTIDNTTKTTIQGVSVGGDLSGTIGNAAESDPLAVLKTTFTADSQVIVGTGSGTYQAESGATLRTSLGLGTTDSPTFSALTVSNTAIDTTASYNGLNLTAIKTAGVTDGSDYLRGLVFVSSFDQSGGVIGTIKGIDGQAFLLAGETTKLIGLNTVTWVPNSGTTAHDVTGALIQSIVMAGTVTGDIYGINVGVLNAVNPTGSVYGIYMSNIGADYGFYQEDTAPNLFKGNLTLGASGTGELTTGSINRASGSLTIEIGGTAQQTITSTETTFAHNVAVTGNVTGSYLGIGSTGDGIIALFRQIGSTNNPGLWIETDESDNSVVMSKSSSTGGGLFKIRLDSYDIWSFDSSGKTTMGYGLDVKGDLTINSDLGDVTSVLTFGRTTGGSGTISYDGSDISINNNILAGDQDRSTNGQKIISGRYNSGELAVFGTSYSSGAPFLGYAVNPSTSSPNSFLSSTGIATVRGALVIDDALRYFAGDSQTVAIGSAVTTAEVFSVTSSGGLILGTDDTARGSVYLYGGKTGVHEGGTLFYFTSADYDATIPYWFMQAYDEDFYISRYGHTDLKIDSNGYLSTGRIGVNSSPTSGYLQIADDLASGAWGMYVYGAASASRDIALFGQSGFSNGFTIKYDHSNTRMVYAMQDGLLGLGTTTPSTYLAGTVGMSIYHDNYPAISLANQYDFYLMYMGAADDLYWYNTTVGNAMTLTHEGILLLPQVYSHNMNGETIRSLQINNAGELGYDSSSIRGKMNVADIADTSWIYNLRPVDYEPKKKVKQDDGSEVYVEESTGIRRQGLIAEEVEKVNPNYVFYDELKDGKKQIAGVYYERLIIPLLAEVQKLHKEIDKQSKKVKGEKGYE